MELSYTPIHETTRQFHLSNAEFRWLMGPLGAGKSFAVVWEILIRAAQQTPHKDTGKRRTKVLFVRNTAQQLRDSVLPILREVLPEPDVGNWIVSEFTYKVRVGDIECDILLRPLENESDIKRVLSINASFVVFDEWRELPVTMIRDVAARGGRFPAVQDEGCTFAGAFGASNPPMEGSDWYVMLEEKRPKNTAVFKFPSARSPEATWRKFLRPNYYENLIEGATDDFVRVMIDGEYGRTLAGRAVYEKSYVPDFHDAPKDAPPIQHMRDTSVPLCVGMDMGRTPSAVVLQKAPRGRVLVLSEAYSQNMGLEVFITEVFKPHMANTYPGMPYYVVGDPAAWYKGQFSEEHAGDIFKRHSIVAHPASTNDPERRIRAVERLLTLQSDGKSAIVFNTRKTPKLVAGLRGGYKYKRKTDGTYENRPEKGDASHLQDALQYGVLGLEGVPLKRAMRAMQQPDEQQSKVQRVPDAAWT